MPPTPPPILSSPLSPHPSSNGTQLLRTSSSTKIRFDWWCVQMTSDAFIPLRRTIQPYVGQTLILLAVTAFLVYVSATSSDWNFMWGPAVYWPLFGVYFFYFGMKYKVLWDEESVVMYASGGPERRIRFDEITSVKKEISSVSDILAQSRPFRRIVVYGRKHHPDARVDISLRHFDLKDIDQLLTAIRIYRPDLDVPTILPVIISR
jgi:hypothetical protein